MNQDTKEELDQWKSLIGLTFVAMGTKLLKKGYKMLTPHDRAELLKISMERAGVTGLIREQPMPRPWADLINKVEQHGRQ